MKHCNQCAKKDQCDCSRCRRERLAAVKALVVEPLPEWAKQTAHGVPLFFIPSAGGPPQ